MSKTKKKNTIINALVFITAIVVVFLGLYFFLKDGNFKSSKEITNSYASGGSGRGAITGTRTTYNFNYGWTFSKGSGKLNSGTTLTGTNPVKNVTYIPNPGVGSVEEDIPYSASYDPTHYTNGLSNGTSTWKEVSLPHTFNDEDTFNNFMETGLTGERTMYSGTAWYKKEFNLASSDSGKTIIIEFEAARQSAKVWVNGNLLTGHYENGFVAFGYEIPEEYLNFGEGNANKNIITVMVDNTYPYKMEGTNSVVSWHDSHWHPNYGGLYRNSYLYVVDDLHLTIPLYSFTEGSGTYVYTDNETSSATHIHVDAEVKNNSASARTFTYRAIIKDMAGTQVLEINSPSSVTLEAGEKMTYNMEGIINDPIRWSTNYPYLYTCEVELLDDGNNVIDNNLNTFGIRTFRFTSDYGFFLNEYYTELDGWGQKSTWEWAAVGAAYPDWMTDYGVKLLKDAGGNYIRFGHTAGSATQINMCDKYGIMVTQPGVDGEGEGGGSGGPYDANTYQLRIETMRDMIVYFRNHPSIIMWEIGNQSNGLNGLADSTFASNISWMDYDLNNYTPKTYIQIFHDLINKYDYGNRDMVAETSSGPYDETTTSSNRLTTIRRVVDYTKPYVDVVETTEGAGAINDLSSVEAEYNRLEARRGYWDNYTYGFTDYINTTTSGTDYANTNGETFATSQITKKKSILSTTGNVGGANWIFSDSISHGRLQSESSRVSGEVDATMLPKGAYYVSQVINSDEPSVYIIGHWNYPIPTTKNVYVAAKGANSVELFVNGVSVGIQNNSGANNYLYTFENITYANGYVEAKAYDTANAIIATHRITSHGEPDHLEVTAISGPAGLIANGSDVLILDVKLLDSNNNVCITYDGEINNTLVNFTYDLDDNGNITGEFLGGHNSAVPTNTRTDNLYLEAGTTRVFVRTTKQAGDISVTATMGTMSDTYTATSVVETNTNGLSTTINETTPYTLNAVNNLGLGSGTKNGIISIVTLPTSKLYIENLAYAGTARDSNGVYDAFAVGEKIYSDTGVTIQTLPYKFINAEIIKLPNLDRDKTDEDLIIFDITRNATVYIARDSRLPEPNWLLNEYTRTLNELTNQPEVITGSNGVTYDIWEKDVTVSVSNGEVVKTSVTIGGNTDIGSDSISGVNQFIFVKETEKVDNRTFFNENFNLFSESDIFNGWNGYLPDIYTTITRADIGNHTALRFTDDNSADLAYARKKFAALSSPFTLKFKAYVGNNKVNTWLRAFISSDYPHTVTDMRNIPIESYLYRDGSGIQIRYKDSEGNSIVGISNNAIPVNAWNIYEYYVDPINHTWNLEVYNESHDTLLASMYGIPFAHTSYLSFTDNSTRIPIDSLNYITFGTGKTATFTTDFYVDDVEIIEDMDIGATSIVVDGHTINLDETIESYVLLDSSLPSDSVITFNETDDYYNYTRINDDANERVTITLENLNSQHYTFNIDYIRNSALEGWTVEPESSSPDPTVTATSTTKDNNLAIHITDTSTTNNTYIYKEITPNTTALKFSFDFYLNSSADFTQEMLKIFLTNGAMGNITDYSNVGVRTYLTPQISTTNEYVTAVKQINSVDNTTMDDTLITKDEWHNIEYYVNIPANMYTVTLDGVKIYENFDFYNYQSQIDHIYIGTDTTGTADFYLKDFTHETVSGKPINGVSINQNAVPNFDNESDTHTYYTDDPLTNDTIVTLITNAFYKTDSETITKDLINKQIIINVLDTLDNVHTYTIVYDTLLNRPISANVLQALVDDASALLPNEANYTYNTWATLITAIADAEEVLNATYNAIPSDYSIAYFELERAMNGLLLILNYSGYETSTVETIKYSENLRTYNSATNSYSEVFSFNKVLDNDKQVYFEDNTNLFTSVPYRFMNAEYILNTNLNYKEGLIVLEPLQDIDILVFKDRDAGPFTENGFVDTGEIATTTDGVIYRIYKKTYDIKTNGVYDLINLEYNKFVNNTVTNNVNIIGFINSAKDGNDVFINENFDIYNSTLFNRTWTSATTSHATNTFNGAIGDIDNNIQLESDSSSVDSYGFGIVYREMAKLKEKISFKFSANFATLNSGFNQYTRTWLRQGPGDIGATSTDISSPTGNSGDKSHALIDLYTYNNYPTNSSIKKPTGTTNATAAAGVMAQTNSIKRLMYQDSGIPVNTWTDIEVTMNLLTRKFSVTYNGYTYPEYSMDNSSVKTDVGSNHNITYADYIYFASRLQGKSNMKFKDIIVEPIDSNLYQDIEVSGTSIGNYKDLTKAYLYKVADTTAYNNATATGIKGTLFEGTDEPSAVPNTTITGNNKKTTIHEDYTSTTEGNVIREYTVYYQVDNDSSEEVGSHGMIDLVNKLQEAQNINSSYYTDDSYNNLVPAISAAITRLADHEAVVNTGLVTSLTDDDITATYLTLDKALNDLVLLSETSFDYSGKIVTDRIYDDYESVTTTDVNITNKSSFTALFDIEARINETYKYEGKTHELFVKTDTALYPGTTITMIDKSGNQDLFYYYIVTQNDYNTEKTSYPLASFALVGTLDDYFVNTYHLDNNIITGSYSFILDFKDATSVVNGMHTISLELFVDSVKISNSDVLNYGIYNASRQMELISSAASESYMNNSTISLTANIIRPEIVIDGITVTDTSLSGKRIAARLGIYDSENNFIPFPKGTTITDGEYTYTLSSDGYLRTSRGSGPTSINRNYTINPGYSGFNTGTYYLKTDLIETYDRFNDNGVDEVRILATDTIEIAISNEPSCSIYSNIEGNTDVIKLNENATLNIDVDTVCYNVSNEQIVTISLYKKTLPGNTDFGYTLLNYQDYVTNSITQPYDANIYKLVTHPYVDLTRTTYEDKYQIHFSNNLTAGLYRLEFNVISGSIRNTDFITFAVK